MKEQAEKVDKQAENEQTSQIKTLNEEISYLKKHYMVEMDVLRQENKLLSIRNQKALAIADGDDYDVRSSQSPYMKNDRQAQSQIQLNRRENHNQSIDF